MAKTNPFHFKQFSIRQEKAAMKVGTDGILLGSWVSVESCRKVLDVGTGTGLIALMLAQGSRAQITALEIEHEAAEEAKLNVQNSPWGNRVTVIKQSYQDYALETATKFDLIVSNPPFFSNSLKAAKTERKLARHTDSLPFSELIACTAKLLSKSGRLALVIPVLPFAEIEQLANENGLFLLRKTEVFPNRKSALNRVLVEFSYKRTNAGCKRLCIYNDTGKYSDEFRELTKAFYLNF